MKSGDAARFVKFGLVGLSGVGVGLGSLRLFIGEFGLPDVLSQGLSFVLAATNNFTWNEIWTFGDRPKESRFADLFKRWLGFLLAYSIGFAVNLGVFILLKRVLHFHYMWAAVCAVAASTPVNYLVSNFWVWRLSPKKPRASPPTESQREQHVD